jgi:DNA end-binding protein Ku
VTRGARLVASRRSDIPPRTRRSPMARPFWKGALSFGLVEIPVSLRPAVHEHDLAFTLLDRENLSPVGNRRYNKATGEEVPWNRVIRGYEYERDEYVVLSDEELKSANVRATQTIDIHEFVHRDEIDPIYFDTPYYIEAQNKASKSYTLLRDALKESGQVGIATVVLRTRQHPAAVIVRDDVMMLELLRHSEDVERPDDLLVPTARSAKDAPSKRELEMAVKLIAGMRGKFEPARYRDDYRHDVLALIERKVKSGETHTIVEPAKGEKAAPAREVIDLMPLLKQSLEQQGGSGTPARRGPVRASRTE